VCACVVVLVATKTIVAVIITTSQSSSLSTSYTLCRRLVVSDKRATCFQRAVAAPILTRDVILCRVCQTDRLVASTRDTQQGVSSCSSMGWQCHICTPCPEKNGPPKHVQI